MAALPASTRVNSVRNDDSGCLSATRPADHDGLRVATARRQALSRRGEAFRAAGGAGLSPLSGRTRASPPLGQWVGELACSPWHRKVNRSGDDMPWRRSSRLSSGFSPIYLLFVTSV